MSTINDSFLDAFRALDSELKFENKTVLDYENSLIGTDQEQLKVCRIMRNYMAHNDTDFIIASKEQIKFLEQQVLNIRKKSSTVKDFMKKPQVVKITEPIKNFAITLNKFNYAPIMTTTGLYIVDKDIYIKQLAQGNKKIIPPARLPKYKYVTKNERMENLTNGLYIVTTTGDSDGDYIGILCV